MHIHRNAVNNFEEFNGLVAAEFPHKEKIRPSIISPRREHVGHLTGVFPLETFRQSENIQKSVRTYGVGQTYHGQTSIEQNELPSIVS